MWLLSMNCAYYAIDVATVSLSNINWEEKTVVFRRGKREKQGDGHRSAVLWGRTIDAIRQYQKDRPHNGKTLFWSGSS